MNSLFQLRLKRTVLLGRKWITYRDSVTWLTSSHYGSPPGGPIITAVQHCLKKHKKLITDRKIPRKSPDELWKLWVSCINLFHTAVLLQNFSLVALTAGALIRDPAAATHGCIPVYLEG